MLRLGVHRIPAAILVLAGLTWQAQAACVFGTAPGCVQVAITNGDFETLPAGGLTGSCAGNGGPGTGGPGCRLTLNGPIPGWSITSSTYSGQFQPGPNYFPLPLPTGLTLGYTNGGTLAQTLTTPLQASTIYTLRVDIGRRLDDLYPNPAPVVQLYAGSTLIATATGVKPELGRFARWTARYQAGAADPLAGQMLRVVLTATTPQGDFDNVSLEAEPVAAPAPCTFTTAPAVGSAPAAGGTGTITVTASGSECAWTASSSAGWLTVTSGASGRGSGTVSYQVAANPGAARSGTITAAGRVFTLNQAAAAPAVPVPAIARGGILNAADYTADLAPGMMVSVWGQNLAPRTAVAEAVPLPLELDGVSVEVSEAGKAAVRAPLFFVSPGQINIQLPFGLTASTIQVRVRSAAGASNTETAALQQSSPRLFTRTMDGKGEPILLHAADYSWVSASAPAVPGEYVILLLTGLGPVSPAIDAGKPGGDDGALGPINWVRNEVAVTVGTAVIRPAFAGHMPRFPGCTRSTSRCRRRFLPGLCR